MIQIVSEELKTNAAKAHTSDGLNRPQAWSVISSKDASWNEQLETS